jgi:hypothetical protein
MRLLAQPRAARLVAERLAVGGKLLLTKGGIWVAGKLVDGLQDLLGGALAGAVGTCRGGGVGRGGVVSGWWIKQVTSGLD